jgi:hypothetical protein
MRMTVEDRDQWECLLRAMVREDHARRAAAPAPQDAP